MYKYVILINNKRPHLGSLIYSSMTYLRMYSLLAGILVLPLLSFSQYSTISGKILSQADNKPIANANVFLDNATIGTSSSHEGTFKLSNIPKGNYTLVVSCVGYETTHAIVIANGTDINLQDIALKEKSLALAEVNIKASPIVDPKRAQYLAMFTKSFLGNSDNAHYCKILNPQSLKLQFRQHVNKLIATSDEELVVENKSLGYKVHYFLISFIRDYNSGKLNYEGYVWFENLIGKPAQQKKWMKNRLNTYMYSSMHFLRSVINHRYQEEGFKVFKIIRKLNPARPADSILEARMITFANHPELQDSLKRYQELYKLPPMTEYLINTPLSEQNFARPIQDNMMELSYSDHLYVIYAPGMTRQLHINIDHPTENNTTYPSSVVSLNAKEAIFDANGILIDPSRVTFEGDWGLSGVADLLPINIVHSL